MSDLFENIGLGPTSRRELRLVDRGVKPSATIGSTQRIDDVLRRRKLLFQRVDPDPEHYKKYPTDAPMYTYDVTRSKRLDQRFKKINEDSFGSDVDKEEDVSGDYDYGAGFEKFGKMYGYPSCCSKRYASDVKHGVNPGQRFAQQLGGRAPPPEMQYYEHVPCSPNCERSKALGRRYAKALGEEIQARHGYHGIISRPTRFLVGEAGPERVNITPLRSHKIQHVRMNNFNVNIGIKGMKRTPSIFGKGSLGKLARF